MKMKEVLERILNHEELTREETRQILHGIAQEEYPDEQISALLTGIPPSSHQRAAVTKLSTKLDLFLLIGG